MPSVVKKSQNNHTCQYVFIYNACKSVVHIFFKKLKENDMELFVGQVVFQHFIICICNFNIFWLDI